ncbi:hypothetical protein HY091_03200 [Candidatus Kaiserbacteria bacterium]|nr:hypothetical protein [Candidatus Kaiserbacteria bacterium]
MWGFLVPALIGALIMGFWLLTNIFEVRLPRTSEFFRALYKICAWVLFAFSMAFSFWDAGAHDESFSTAIIGAFVCMGLGAAAVFALSYFVVRMLRRAPGHDPDSEDTAAP